MAWQLAHQPVFAEILLNVCTMLSACALYCVDLEDESFQKFLKSSTSAEVKRTQ